MSAWCTRQPEQRRRSPISLTCNPTRSPEPAVWAQSGIKGTDFFRRSDMADAKDKSKKPLRAFTVRAGRIGPDGKFVHNSGFLGDRQGLKFRDGICVTDDAIKAHACLELGYEVLDE